MRLQALASAILLVLPGEFRAQALPIAAGDTLRVWHPGRTLPSPPAMLTSIAADTLFFTNGRLRVPELQRIDVARGTTVPRSKMAAFVGTGLVLGVTAGFLVKDHACGSCDTLFDFVSLGASVGAGAGYLVSRLAKIPRWYTVWPRDLEPHVEAARPVDTTRVANGSHFMGVRSGDEIRYWTADPGIQRGKFARLTSDETGMLLRDRAPVPLASINALEVGRRQTTRGALLGAVAVGAPTALIASVACVLTISGCDSEKMLVAIGVGSFIGFGAGAWVGSTRVTWTLRFTR